MKVHIYPSPVQAKEDNGIGRVVHAQYKYLPQMGIELVEQPSQADIVALHTQQHGYPYVDALHLHGLYWTGDPGSGEYLPWHHKANKVILEAVRRALAVSVPSEWVGECLRRDMRINPTVLGHGLDLEQWQPAEQTNIYALWNKNRAGDVCDPTPSYVLARRGVPVVSTFAPPSDYTPLPHYKITGSLPADQMMSVVQHAGVYLATVKETFGIGTLEALACGVPVLGYRWGGTAQLVNHLEEGFLVEPGDVDGLVAGYHYLLERREEFKRRCLARAQEYSWTKAMARYVEFYQQVYDLKKAEKHTVSIVITNHNYQKYVAQAVDSALSQTTPCEVVVVDDGSTDGSADFLKQAYGSKIKLVAQKNQGVAAARNVGIGLSSGDYVVCLDADDYLHPQYAELLSGAMKTDRGLGVAYTGLTLIRNEVASYYDGWPPEFSWEVQRREAVPPANCIPSAAMFRRKMWQRAGGYRQQYAPGEDAEFWTRGLSLGFTARRVASEGLFHYRIHSGSASRTKQYKTIGFWNSWMMTKQWPIGAPSEEAPFVRSYSQPTIAVIIPVTKKHFKYLFTAIESVISQTYTGWELYVILDWLDSKTESQKIKNKFPFVRVVETDQGGPGHARNVGLVASYPIPLITFLDADDVLMPDALNLMLGVYSKSGGRYVYTDWIADEGGVLKSFPSKDYGAEAALEAPLHPVTALVPRTNAIFDEHLESLEDYDFYAQLALKGVHGVRLPEPLVLVKIHPERRTAERHRREHLVLIQKRYEDKTPMPCCGGNAPKIAYEPVASALPITAETEPMSGKVRMKFTGQERGATSYGGPGLTPTGRAYRGGNNLWDQYVDAEPADVEWLTRTGRFEVVAMAKPLDTKEVPVATLRLDVPEVETEAEPVVDEAPRKRGRPKKTEDES